MVAPTFVSVTSTALNNFTSPKTTASIAVQAGDVLVASGECEIASFSTTPTAVAIATASGSTSAWTLQQDQTYPDLNHAYLRTWTATATASGNITVSFTMTGGGIGSLEFGGWVHVFRNSA